MDTQKIMDILGGGSEKGEAMYGLMNNFCMYFVIHMFKTHCQSFQFPEEAALHIVDRWRVDIQENLNQATNDINEMVEDPLGRLFSVALADKIEKNAQTQEYLNDACAILCDIAVSGYDDDDAGGEESFLEDDEDDE